MVSPYQSIPDKRERSSLGSSLCNKLCSSKMHPTTAPDSFCRVVQCPPFTELDGYRAVLFPGICSLKKSSSVCGPIPTEGLLTSRVNFTRMNQSGLTWFLGTLNRRLSPGRTLALNDSSAE